MNRQRVYLAARYEAREQVDALAKFIRSSGHVVASRWHNLDKEFTPYGAPGTPEKHAASQAAESAQDRGDLARSTCLVSCELFGDLNSRGGRHVEFGIMLGQGKPVAILGEPWNLFHRLPDVEVLSSPEAIVKWLNFLSSEAANLASRSSVLPCLPGIIAFHGAAGVGKGRCAMMTGHVLDKMGIPTFFRSFGDPIREALSVLTGLRADDYKDSDIKKARSPFSWPDGTPMTNREALQCVGGAIRSIDGTAFVKAAERRLPSNTNNTVVVYDDLRMEEEYRWLRGKGAVLVYVSGYDRTGTMTERAAADVTAKLLYPRLGFDYVINNDLGLAELRTQIEKIIDSSFGTSEE